jgi:uncharacterized membrane protein YbjE (DUF340 family)
MIFVILISVISGILVGNFFLSPELASIFNQLSTCFLALLLLGVGIDIGKNKEVVSKMKKIGWKIVMVPIVVALGSIIGTIVSGYLLALPVNEASAIGAGFGWYSLSGVLIAKLYDIQIGSLAFLTNIFRELLAIILIPILAKIGGKLTLIAPGGATTMDTTLPLIIKSSGTEIGVIAFVNGVILSSLVPILVPLLIKL